MCIHSCLVRKVVLLISFLLTVDLCASFGPASSWFGAHISSASNLQSNRIMQVSAAASEGTNGNKNEPESGEDLASSIATLRIEGPDSKGIVAAFAQTLYGHGCNMIDSEQHSDESADRFFQRIVFDYGNMHTDRVSLETGINEVCNRFGMTSYTNWGDAKKKVWYVASFVKSCSVQLCTRLSQICY